jgi:hypothetical protein
LVLRALDSADTEAVVKVFADPEMSRLLGADFSDPEQARAMSSGDWLTTVLTVWGTG